MAFRSVNISERNFLNRLDIRLILLIFCLNVIGLFNLYSATHGPHSNDVEPLFVQQIVWLLGGWTIFFILTFLDYLWVNKIVWLIYILNVGALIYTDLMGKVVLGGQRWIDLHFFRYQPSETMKLCIILLLSRILVNRNPMGYGMGLRELLLPAVLIFIPFALTVKQPDLGTAMMLMFIGGTMLFFVKIRKSIIIFIATLALIAIPLAWKYGLKEYQRNRIFTFLSPDQDPHGTGYNSIQSKIAVGSGKFFGKGFRMGTQSQLEFLPERHTDFIFSVLSEEWGFVGSIIVLLTFAFLFKVCFEISLQARDKYGALIVIGVTAYIFWHMFVNIGMVIGLLPIVGVPLPLLSYGGSGMLTTMVGLGLVSSIAYRRYLF
ncbi:MAG: rod shape-determining protein RodA [Bdellovibrionales bacterium RIFCSPHIGHO2_01_FULL_40_29]|nr:MAG: rod shape-determining protein RodA [Bdellovibrionales bacterium RIFCSPHIGHO2_01_FULL_40_29]OFZ32680.1 MAG: rod shape-determining protein RodA [Bdellovibrionales bacterium RIFCSPHIGHO2_02_FULL_40_15]